MAVANRRRTKSKDRAPKSETTKRWLTAREAAEYLGVTERWVKRAQAEGRLPYSKRNRLVRFDRFELDDVIEQQRVPARTA